MYYSYHNPPKVQAAYGYYPDRESDSEERYISSMNQVARWLDHNPGPYVSAFGQREPQDTYHSYRYSPPPKKWPEGEISSWVQQTLEAPPADAFTPLTPPIFARRDSPWIWEPRDLDDGGTGTSTTSHQDTDTHYNQRGHQTPWIWTPRDLDDDGTDTASTSTTGTSRQHTDSDLDPQQPESFTAKCDLRPTFSSKIIRTPEHYRYGYKHPAGSSSFAWSSTSNPNFPTKRDFPSSPVTGPILAGQLSEGPDSIVSPFVLSKMPLLPAPSTLHTVRDHSNSLLVTQPLDTIPEQAPQVNAHSQTSNWSGAHDRDVPYVGPLSRVKSTYAYATPSNWDPFYILYNEHDSDEASISSTETEIGRTVATPGLNNTISNLPSVSYSGPLSRVKFTYAYATPSNWGPSYNRYNENDSDEASISSTDTEIGRTDTRPNPNNTISNQPQTSVAKPIAFESLHQSRSEPLNAQLNVVEQLMEERKTEVPQAEQVYDMGRPTNQQAHANPAIPLPQTTTIPIQPPIVIANVSPLSSPFSHTLSLTPSSALSSICSKASSRTVSTDYGMFYTRMAISLASDE